MKAIEAIKKRLGRLVFCPFIALMLLAGDTLPEVVFRLWLVLFCTANWALGDASMAELQVVVLRDRLKKLESK